MVMLKESDSEVEVAVTRSAAGYYGKQSYQHTKHAFYAV